MGNESKKIFFFLNSNLLICAVAVYPLSQQINFEMQILYSLYAYQYAKALSSDQRVSVVALNLPAKQYTVSHYINMKITLISV
jgi:hypothetical protein